MGYYCAWGDAKMIYSSEEEGYENVSEKRRGCVSGVFGEAPSTPAPPISDDTDRQFWAEDELSNSESRQRLTGRRKRRHSVFYRNRIASGSQSRAFHSSNSTSDSIHVRTSPKARKVRRYCRCQLKFKPENLQFMNVGGTSCTSIEETARTMNEISLECPIAFSSDQKSTDLFPENHQTVLSYENHTRADDTWSVKRIRKKLKKTCGPFKTKQK